MTEQPDQRPDGTGPADSPPPYEPPAFVPPQGSEVTPPPLYDQSQYGQYGQGQYGQDPYNQNQFNQGYNPGQVGAPYGQEQYGSTPYGQPGQPGPYGQPGQQGLYGQPGPYGQPMYYGAQPQPKGLSIASLVCGIVAVVIGIIMVPQIAAIVTGHLGLKREPAGKAMSITGLVLGYLCLLGYGFVWLLMIIGMTIASSTYSY